MLSDRVIALTIPHLQIHAARRRLAASTSQESSFRAPGTTPRRTDALDDRPDASSSDFAAMRPAPGKPHQPPWHVRNTSYTFFLARHDALLDLSGRFRAHLRRGMGPRLTSPGLPGVCIYAMLEAGNGTSPDSSCRSAARAGPAGPGERLRFD